VIATAAQLTSNDPTIAAVERAFSSHVAERYNGRILRYSQRLDLLKAAQRLRINRFRANLIIAMVQHQSTQRPSIPEPQEVSPRNQSISGMGPIIAGVLLVEVAMVAGVWLMLHF
jgi:hypothetical protein